MYEIWFKESTAGKEYGVVAARRSEANLIAKVAQVNYVPAGILATKEKVVLSFSYRMAHWPDDAISSFHYHPGQLPSLGNAAWEFAGALIKAGAIAYAMASYKPVRENPRLGLAVTAGGAAKDYLNSAVSTDNALAHLKDARRYHREGYYRDDSSSELIFLGKITSADLHLI